jgi:uncharacterized membrane protein YdbT with pleckstrin-like domain
MGYVDSNLLPGEAITYRAKLHPMIFAGAGFLTAIAVGLFAISAIESAGGFGVAGAVIVLIAAIRGVSGFLRYVSSEFAITDKRVVIKVGLLKRHTVELLLTKVETIGVDQTILGRIFNYGTIIVTGTGGTKEPFSSIANPLEFRRQVQARLAG